MTGAHYLDKPAQGLPAGDTAQHTNGCHPATIQAGVCGAMNTQPNTHYWIATCIGTGMAEPSLRLRAPNLRPAATRLVFRLEGLRMDQNKQNRRRETVMVTFRFPKELYDRLPVQKATNAGKEGGISAYLRRHMIASVERDLAATPEEQAA